MGTMKYPNGKKEVGYWKNNKKHGRGYIIHPNGKKEYVEWNYGQKENANKKS
jgi:hypothetical protein